MNLLSYFDLSFLELFLVIFIVLLVFQQYVFLGFLCIGQYFKIKKTPATKIAEAYNIRYYLCFLVSNFPPLISFSKKEPSASPTSVNETPEAPS